MDELDRHSSPALLVRRRAKTDVGCAWHAYRLLALWWTGQSRAGTAGPEPGGRHLTASASHRPPKCPPVEPGQWYSGVFVRRGVKGGRSPQCDLPTKKRCVLFSVHIIHPILTATDNVATQRPPLNAPCATFCSFIGARTPLARTLGPLPNTPLFVLLCLLLLLCRRILVVH